jgi:transcriptional regulator with XRE-family HTH domain
MESKYSIRLRDTLDLLDIKQSELARKTGVTEATISDYINAKKTPRLGVVEKIADVLNVSVDYLLGRSNNLQTDKIFDINNLSQSEINEIKIYIDFLKYKKKNLGKGEAI